MTPAELRTIRKAAAPDMTQAAFARLLGYADADSYRRYESGHRPIPHLLAMLMRCVERYGITALHDAR